MKFLRYTVFYMRFSHVIFLSNNLIKMEIFCQYGFSNANNRVGFFRSSLKIPFLLEKCHQYKQAHTKNRDRLHCWI